MSASVAVMGFFSGLSRDSDAAKLGGLGAVGARSVGGPLSNWFRNAARRQRRARVARNGDSGLHIARLQNLLNAKLVGPPPLWVDGKFGANTENRVKAFQGRIDGTGFPGT